MQKRTLSDLSQIQSIIYEACFLYLFSKIYKSTFTYHDIYLLSSIGFAIID